MKRISMILFFYLFHLTYFASTSVASDMSQGLQCPPGWTDNTSTRGNDLIKQCISPRQDGAIELYSAPGQQVPLGSLLDMWAKEMTQRGLPFQNFVSEVPGQVSGYPAVTRTYSGQTREGNQFDSHLVASRYNGVNYVFQGFAIKGHSDTWRQLRHSMNTWYYPGAGQPNHGGQQGGLPIGAGSSNFVNDPYGNDPYGSTQQNSQQPLKIRIDRYGNGCEAMLKIYDNNGLIMDVQSTYAGDRPFNNQPIGGNWKSTKHKKFYKIVIQNHSDSPIQFTKIVVNSFRVMTQYCTGATGNSYTCGKGKKITKNLNNGKTTLNINGQYTNTLYPGQTSVRQGYSTFNNNNFRGKKETYTYFFTYKDQTFSFDICRHYH